VEEAGASGGRGGEKFPRANTFVLIKFFSNLPANFSHLGGIKMADHSLVLETNEFLLANINQNGNHGCIVVTGDTGR